jgi:hypothetical protein
MTFLRKNDLCNVKPVAKNITKINVQIHYMASPFLIFVSDPLTDNFTIEPQPQKTPGKSICAQIATKIFQKITAVGQPTRLVTEKDIKSEFRQILRENLNGTEEVSNKRALSDYSKYARLLLFDQSRTGDPDTSRLIVIMRPPGGFIAGQSLFKIDEIFLQTYDYDLRYAVARAAREMARLDLQVIEDSDIVRNVYVEQQRANVNGTSMLGRYVRNPAKRAYITLTNPTRTAKKIGKRTKKIAKVALLSTAAFAVGKIAGKHYAAEEAAKFAEEDRYYPSDNDSDTD